MYLFEKTFVNKVQYLEKYENDKNPKATAHFAWTIWRFIKAKVAQSKQETEWAKNL